MEYRKINTLDLLEVETEIEFLMGITEKPSEKLVKEIVSLMKIAKALGTEKRYWIMDNGMITLSFDTWEEFDEAISDIAKITILGDTPKK
jgi:hypothetical protein